MILPRMCTHGRDNNSCVRRGSLHSSICLFHSFPPMIVFFESLCGCRCLTSETAGTDIIIQLKFLHPQFNSSIIVFIESFSTCFTLHVSILGCLNVGICGNFIQSIA